MDFNNKVYMEKAREMVCAAVGGKKPLAYTSVHGCAQNSADMEFIRGMLAEMGYGFTQSAESADIIVVNTCAVREGAELKIYGSIGQYKKLKNLNKNLIITLCGCMMQQAHIVEKIKKSYPYVDIVFGTHNIGDFPVMLCRRLESGKKVFEIAEKGEIVENMPVLREGKGSFNVSIMYGCDNFCSYCIVPYTRGRERSRKPENIIAEIKEMAEKGCSEVMLLGQNVNSYGKGLEENINFAKLLRMINDINSIKRIRFMTSHPKDLSDELIDAMADCEKVCKYLHLPVQSGSSRILKLMNRKYTKEQYLELIGKIKARIPNIALSTDIIVGFPGETDEDFKETMNVLETVRYDMVFSFIYSRRSGTAAAKLPDVQSEEEKHRNLSYLLEIQRDINYEKNLKYKDKICEVLVEGESREKAGVLTGRTQSNKIVHFEGEKNLIGSYVNVKITEIKSFYLKGEL